MDPLDAQLPHLDKGWAFYNCLPRDLVNELDNLDAFATDGADLTSPSRRTLGIADVPGEVNRPPSAVLAWRQSLNIRATLSHPRIPLSTFSTSTRCSRSSKLGTTRCRRPSAHFRHTTKRLKETVRAYSSTARTPDRHRAAIILHHGRRHGLGAEGPPQELLPGRGHTLCAESWAEADAGTATGRRPPGGWAASRTLITSP